MTTNQNSGAPDGQGGWQPVPQGGEYDAEATAFVQLPPEDAADAPLAAPGHGYVPPQIVPLTPTVIPASGSWGTPPPREYGGGGQWPEPEPAGGGQPGAQHPQDDLVAGSAQFQAPPLHDTYVTGQWNFGDAGPGADGAGGGGNPSELTGQWAIPVAEADLKDDSGEFSAALLASPWSGGAPPATLPGGAAAPWATPQEPAPAEPARHDSAVPRSGPPAPAAGPAAEAGAAGSRGSASGPAEVPGFPAAPDPTGLTGTADPAGTPEPAGVRESTARESTARESGVLAEFTSGPLPEPVPAAGAATDPEAGPGPEPAPLTSSNDSAEHPANSYVLRVNGADRPVTDAWIGESLLYVLRERLGLAGAKDGCSQGECGACNVQVDGRLVASCLVPAATAAGSEVRTVEGLAVDGEPSDVQRALANCGAVQCGFCIPGMAMTIHDLLEGNHAPSELETRQALCGNLCRCSGYRGVLDAVSEVAAERTASAEAAAAASEEARVPHQAPPGAGSAQPSHSHDGGMA